MPYATNMLGQVSSMAGHYYCTALDDLLKCDLLSHAPLLLQSHNTYWAEAVSRHRCIAFHEGHKGKEEEDKNVDGAVELGSRVKVPAQRALLCEWLFMFALCHPKAQLRT
uniref:Aquaporin-B n=1 Tax=Lygus hesperus TaxID=30085 RepID=A0A0A9YK13_LYGHE